MVRTLYSVNESTWLRAGTACCNTRCAKIAPKTKRAADAIGTVRVHRELEALCRCKSGTGPRPGIVPASSGSVSVIAALSHLTCQVSVGNDGAREDCGKEKVCLPSYTLEDASRAHSGMCIECAGKAA